MARLDWFLYAVVVFGWSTSWLPLKWQLDMVAPEVSLFWRFLIAAPLMVALVFVSGQSMRHGWRAHLHFAALGLCMFSVNFTLFYYAGKEVASGMLAVVFASASLVNVVMEAALGRRVPRLSHVLATSVGIGGVTLLYLPELQASSRAFYSLLLCGAGTLFFCSGNMVSMNSQRIGVPVLVSVAWSMVYGATYLGVFSAGMGYEFIVEPTPRYIGGLLWLAVFSSVATFSCYLLLIGRIGASRTSYATVVFPVFALLISAGFENYQWSVLGVCGLILVLCGNLFMMRMS